MNIYIVQGGIGKHVMFSSLIEKLYKMYGKKIIIMSSYPDLFQYHPRVEASVMYHEAGFYDEYIKDTENNIIYTEPYYSNFIKGKTHLIEEWAKLYNIDYVGDLPDIYIDDYAVEESKRFVEQFPSFIVTQFSGGQSPINIDPHQPFVSTGQIKDYPRNLAQELVNKIKLKYPDMTILNYALPNEQSFNLKNTIHIESPYLFYVNLLNYCKSYIGVDSSLQHFAANRYNKKNGVVLWGSTDPNCLGYTKNINLSKEEEAKHSMRPLCNPVGDIYNKDGGHWIHEDEDCMNIDPDKILCLMEASIEENWEVEVDTSSNIVKNENMLDINEKTRNILTSLEGKMNQLNIQFQTVINTYIASQNKEGNYDISADGKKLVRVQ